MHKLDDLRDKLCEELDHVAKKDEISTSDLDIIDKLTHSIKNIDKIALGDEMREEYGHNYSNARRDLRRGRDADRDGRYSEDRHYDYDRSYERDYGRRSRDGYSGHYDDEHIERFKHMMQDAIHEL